MIRGFQSLYFHLMAGEPLHWNIWNSGPTIADLALATGCNIPAVIGRCS